MASIPQRRWCLNRHALRRETMIIGRVLGGSLVPRRIMVLVLMLTDPSLRHVLDGRAGRARRCHRRRNCQVDHRGIAAVTLLLTCRRSRGGPAAAPSSGESSGDELFGESLETPSVLRTLGVGQGVMVAVTASRRCCATRVVTTSVGGGSPFTPAVQPHSQCPQDMAVCSQSRPLVRFS
jgi:hypothetical protein